MTQVLRLINWWMEVPFAGRRRPGGWSGGGGSSLLKMLNLSCLLSVQLGISDMRLVLVLCTNFSFSTPRHMVGCTSLPT